MAYFEWPLTEGDAQLTHLLTETTKNLLVVLAMNVVQHMDVPVSFDEPFDSGATATAKSTVQMLRRQIGVERCRQIIRTERGRGNKPGGVRLGDVEVVGTGRRDVVRYGRNP